ncbi:hypothetical protein BD626DRAFT_586286 [Schizophyllum amplum]|uniref:Uncharacterized protein n=1 Tax=Schizophyllum amplum TaxID=97359 RepID=A0A550C021_9AGAR|nr:hypothetical protein BD626DRAFT_586286 [Auriculariopsis ampla]
MPTSPIVLTRHTSILTAPGVLFFECTVHDQNLRVPIIDQNSLASLPRIERSDDLLQRSRAVAYIRLLHDGGYPLPQDASLARSCSDDLLLEIERIAAEMRRLSALQDELVTQRNITLSLIAPIRKLPAELLSRIFLDLVSDDPPEKHARIVLKTVVPVCATWREVAWSTPALWTCIDGVSRIVKGGDVLLNAQLRASGDLPLTLRYKNDYYRNAEMLEFLLPYAARWGDIAFSTACPTLAGFGTPDLPLLSRADISLCHPYDAHAFEFLERAVALRRLDIQATSAEDADGGDPGLSFPVLPPLPSLVELSIRSTRLEMTPTRSKL